MSNPTIAFIPIARTTFDIPLAEQVSQSAFEALSQLPVKIIGSQIPITDIGASNDTSKAHAKSKPDLLVIFQATFADSSMVMSIAETVDAPIFLWGIPEEHSGGRLRLNSFCGINLAGHALTRAGFRYEHIFAAPEDAQAHSKILTQARASHALNTIKGQRLGRVGENPDGFETCLFDSELIQEKLGIEIVQYDLEQDIFPKVKQVEAAEVEPVRAKVNEQVEGLDELDNEATNRSLGVFKTLEKTAAEDKLSGYSVRCWPEFFTELGCAACGAMSLLSDQMTPCSCEADVNGTISQLMLQSLSGEPAFGTDVVSLDSERDAVVIWHCGLAPLSLADPQKRRGVTIHSNRKLPLLFEFSLKPGPVTIARLSEASGEYRLVIGKAKMISGPMSFSGTSGLLHFKRPANEILDLIVSNGLEHHISLTYGDYLEELLALADFLDLPVFNLNND